jgi:hypothetical protein
LEFESCLVNSSTRKIIIREKKMKVPPASHSVNDSSPSKSTEQNKGRAGKEHVNPPKNTNSSASHQPSTGAHRSAPRNTPQFVGTKPITAQTPPSASTKTKLAAVQKPNLTVPEPVQKKSNSLVEAANTAGHRLTSALGGSALAQGASLVASGATTHNAPPSTSLEGQKQRTNLFQLSSTPNPNWTRTGQQADTAAMVPLPHASKDSVQPQRVNHIKLDAEKKDPNWAGPFQQQTVTGTIPANKGISSVHNAEGKTPGRVQVLGNDLHLGVFGATGYTPLDKENTRLLDSSGRIFDVKTSKDAHHITNTLTLNKTPGYSSTTVLPENTNQSVTYTRKSDSPSSKSLSHEGSAPTLDHNKETSHGSPGEKMLHTAAGVFQASGLKEVGTSLMATAHELPVPGPVKSLLSVTGAVMLGTGGAQLALHPYEAGKEAVDEKRSPQKLVDQVNTGLAVAATAESFAFASKSGGEKLASHLLKSRSTNVIKNGTKWGGLGAATVGAAVGGVVFGPWLDEQIEKAPAPIQKIIRPALAAGMAIATGHELHDSGKHLNNWAEKVKSVASTTQTTMPLVANAENAVAWTASKLGAVSKFLGSSRVRESLLPVAIGAHAYASAEENKSGAAVGAGVLSTVVGLGARQLAPKLRISPIVSDIVGRGIGAYAGRELGSEAQKQLQKSFPFRLP